MEQEKAQENLADSSNPVAQQHIPTPEEIERTRKVMHDSLSARKPKGFFASIKEWFR